MSSVIDRSMSMRLLFLLLSSPGVLGGCSTTSGVEDPYLSTGRGVVTTRFTCGCLYPFEYRVETTTYRDERVISRASSENGHATVPDGVERLGLEDDAFDGCRWLVSITLPDSLTSLGDRAFSGCTSLTSITLPERLTSIGGSAFELSAFGSGAFSGCTSLTSIALPDSLTSLGDRAFSGCTSLTSITLPDSLTSLGDYAFNGCSALALVYVPTGCSVGTNAFYGTAGGFAYRYGPALPPPPPMSPPPTAGGSRPGASSSNIEGSSSNIGAIAGGAVGGSLALIAAICITIFIAHKKRSPAAGNGQMSGVLMIPTSHPKV